MVKLTERAGVLTLILLCGLTTTARAADTTYQFNPETHAAFFSAETKQPTVVDPQVFVADTVAPAGTGPQNIVHIAGYRPARPGSDASGAPVFTAQGQPLNLTLGSWLGATASGSISCAGDTAVVNAQLRGLVPGGLYQMTRLQFTPQGPKRSPMGQPDGTGSTFVAGANGSAAFSGQVPFCPAATEGIVVAYHSDNNAHGAAMGDLGINLHNELAGHLRVGGEIPRAMPATGGGMTHLAWPVTGVALTALVGLAVASRRRLVR